MTPRDAGTPRESLDSAVRRSDDLYRTFFQHSNEGIWRFELQEPMPITLPLEQQLEHCYRVSVLAECNAAMARMYGYDSTDDLVGASLGDLLPPDDPNAREFLRAFLGSDYRLIGVESNERTRQGEERVFLNSLVGIVVNGYLERVWGTQSDITASKLLEKQFRQAQRMEAVGRLAGGIAHDFNNLLTVIMGSAQLILESVDTGGPAREEAEELQKAAERATALTTQLLAFSRRQQLNPRVLELNEVVADMEKLLRRLIRGGVELRTVLTPEMSTIRADPSQVEQVIANLAVNARDAMPEGGTLTIETQRTVVDANTVRDEVDVKHGSYVVLVARDTGEGMDEETRSRIFEPFFTTKGEGKGTGLGLATVYGIVKQSGGFISVETVPNQGTTFRIFFPAVDADSTA